MAILITQVDRTSGNYQDVFIYTINSSFNGISGDIASAKIKIFIPDMMNVYLGDINDPIQDVIEEDVSGGKNIIFDFGAITDLGIAVRIGLGVTFRNTAYNGAEYIFHPEMIINGEVILDDVSESIYLEVNTRFEISRKIVLPTTNPAPGGTVYFEVILQNFGDLGGRIDNIEIKCNSTDGLMIDTEFMILGEDKSSNEFQDISQDGILGVVADNNVTFTIPNYYGEKYAFIYKAIISSDVLAGADLNTALNWSINSTNQSDDFHTLALGLPEYSATISLYGPDYTLADEYICYDISIENNGNQILSNVNLVDELPQEINYYEFSTGIFHIGAIEQEINAEYTILYQTNNGLTGTLGPYQTSINTTVDLTTIIDENDSISTLSWTLLQLGIGVKTKKSPHIKGVVKSTTPTLTSILNHIELTWIESNETKINIDNHSTIVDNICILHPRLIQNPSNVPVKPGERITFNIGATCRRSHLSNPILGMILPNKLKYVGNVVGVYSDHFEQNTTPVTPPAIVIENFNELGETFIKFDFSGEYGYNFKQKSIISIRFDTEVNTGAQGNFSTTMILNTSNSTGFIPSSVNVYRDNSDIADNVLVSKNYAQSDEIDSYILFFVSIVSDKKVKGMLDLTFVEEPNIGKTLQGGEVEYKITLTNTGNADLERVEIVDILPHVGDTGVIEHAVNRGSELRVYQVSEVIGRIYPQNQAVVFDISYSNSVDPVRFGSSFNVIGSDDNWMNSVPDNLIDIKSFKIATKDVKLLPNETLEVTVKTAVPVGTPVSNVAWNSFAADIVYKDITGVEQHLLAIEPEKVGVQVVESPIDKGEIGGIVWFDDNYDGLFSDVESGISDVGVVLYDINGTPLRASFTTPNFQGDSGYYLFNNLDIGQYYIRFFIESNQYKFTKQMTNQSNGSKANMQTGITSIINLAITPNVRDVHAGIVNKDNRSIDEILNVNNSTRHMMKNVIYNQMLISMKYEDVIDLI